MAKPRFGSVKLTLNKADTNSLTEKVRKKLEIHQLKNLLVVFTYYFGFNEVARCQFIKEQLPHRFNDSVNIGKSSQLGKHGFG